MTSEAAVAAGKPLVMTDKTFLKFSQFIQSNLGIKMPATKKNMLQSRLAKRMRCLKMRSFEEYYDYIFGQMGADGELTCFINAVTTNKTDFFREPVHFDILVRQVLPSLRPGGDRRPLRVWSVASSSGEEPYTLAMVLDEYCRNHGKPSYSIVATDICTEVLSRAVLGIYDEERFVSTPKRFLRLYVMRSRDKKSDKMRIVPDLRSKVSFRRLNLMDEEYDVGPAMDIIFCRNVLIYFDRMTQDRVLARICDHLKAGGYLFTGHSETLSQFRLPLVQTAQTVYRKVGGA